MKHTEWTYNKKAVNALNKKYKHEYVEAAKSAGLIL
jgi:hypothetical protein